MKFMILSALVASAAALPLEDTADVLAAKASFRAAFEMAEQGEHINLAPKQIENSYLDDAEDVAQAKAEFTKAFEAAEAGEVPAVPVATPVITVPSPVVYSAAHPAVYNAAPYNYAPYYNTYANHFPYANNFYGYGAGYGYGNVYAGAHPGFYGAYNGLYNNAFYTVAPTPVKLEEA